jgi:hypothetical protein
MLHWVSTVRFLKVRFLMQLMSERPRRCRCGSGTRAIGATRQERRERLPRYPMRIVRGFEAATAAVEGRA